MFTETLDRSFIAKTMLVLFAVAMVFVGLALVWQASRVFLLSFAGLLFAVFLNALTRGITKRITIRYGWALTTTVVLLSVSFIGGWILLSAQVAEQVTQLTETLPQSVEQVQQRVTQHPWGEWLLSQSQLARSASQRAGVFRQVTGIATSAFDFALDVVIILFVGIYLAAEPDMYRRGLLHLVPQQKRPRVEQVLHALAVNLRLWIYARLMAMAVIGVLTAIGLQIMGMPMVLTLALLAAFLQLVPNFGPILSAIPALLVALPQGMQMVGYVILLYCAVQVVETYLVTPLAERKMANLPPALTLLVMVLLGILNGALGLVVAAPLTLAVLVIVKMLYVEDQLGDQSTVVVGEAPRSAA